MKRRMGKFEVSAFMLHDQEVHDKFAETLAKMRFVPFRVEYLAYADKFEYIGTSPLFKELEEGMYHTEYIIRSHDDEDGNVESVTVEERYENNS